MVAVTAGSYLVGKEMTGWLRLLCAAPIAAPGFFSYNGQPLEQLAWAFIKSEFLCARPRRRIPDNIYYTAWKWGAGFSKKSFSEANKWEKDKFAIPRSVQRSTGA